MEKTDHVMVAGGGAERLAKAFRLENRNPVTSDAKRSWKFLRARLAREGVDYLPRTSQLIHEFPEVIFAGTVGAVAQDDDGNVAAGTSTGGLPLKLPGRVADTSLIGSGTYADKSGGCSVTGVGEGAIRLVLAKTACEKKTSG